MALLQPVFAETAESCDRGNDSPHVQSLWYEIVAIVHAIASYPFGEFDGYLLRHSHGVLQEQSDMTVDSPVTLMDRIKRLAYDFKRELRHRPRLAGDRPSIGELARETLAKLKERHAPARSPTQTKISTVGTGEPPPHYIFARPKSKAKKSTKRRGNNSADDVFSHCLMLDPLFDQASAPVAVVARVREGSRASMDEQGDNEDLTGHAFYQELERQGHCVQFRGRRAKRGDRYFPSLGRLHIEQPDTVLR
ncbi:hypothetical protein PINS_up023270 [Pythium insidiosum]|nr:hypothetical protein PINS_up023270 [Pythium insidiosum]